MQKRPLGNSALEVSAIGLGCMPLSSGYAPADEAEALATLTRALDLGVNFLDTADVYGAGHNETLVGQAIAGRRDEVVLASKFGQVPQGDGTVRALGLSEAGAETLRRAQATHPISALQSEYSLWTRDPEPEVLPACRELGISLVCFSPLGRGFLTGAVRRREDLGENDYRRTIPRFEQANFDDNLAQLAVLDNLARAKGCSTAQIALAWLLAQGSDILPIPGTRKSGHLEDNAAALELALSADELAALDQAFAGGAASGARYRPVGLAMVNR